jgi:DNA mismatch endonuclease (patch repair protein)
MAAIRSKNTRAEHQLRRALRERGLTGYRCHHRKLPGKPDIAFTRWRVAIFIDGAFWHGHPDHFTFGKLGGYWDEKVRRTQQRDREQQKALTELGYDVLRFWDFEVKEDSGRCAALVEAHLRMKAAVGTRARQRGMRTG